MSFCSKASSASSCFFSTSSDSGLLRKRSQLSLLSLHVRGWCGAVEWMMGLGSAGQPLQSARREIRAAETLSHEIKIELRSRRVAGVDSYNAWFADLH
jgi:hypothetical protein